MDAIRNISASRLERFHAKSKEFLWGGHGFDYLGHAAGAALLSETEQFGMVSTDAIDEFLLQWFFICANNKDGAKCASTWRLIGGLCRINLKLGGEWVLEMRRRGRRFGK